MHLCVCVCVWELDKNILLKHYYAYENYVKDIYCCYNVFLRDRLKQIYESLQIVPLYAKWMVLTYNLQIYRYNV